MTALGVLVSGMVVLQGLTLLQLHRMHSESCRRWQAAEDELDRAEEALVGLTHLGDSDGPDAR